MAQKRKVDRAIEALLTAPSIVAASEQAKIPRRTLTRWLREDESFREALRRRRSELTAHADGRIIALLARAVDCLRDALDGKEVSKDAFLSAKVVLEVAREISADDLAERVGRLEAISRQRPYSGQYDGLTDEQLVEGVKAMRATVDRLLAPDSTPGGDGGNGAASPAMPSVEDLRRARDELGRLGFE
jgi:hypothetical protein